MYIILVSKYEQGNAHQKDGANISNMTNAVHPERHDAQLSGFMSGRLNVVRIIPIALAVIRSKYIIFQLINCFGYVSLV